jgi:hypothetical protein
MPWLLARLFFWLSMVPSNTWASLSRCLVGLVWDGLATEPFARGFDTMARWIEEDSGELRPRGYRGIRHVNRSR